MVKNSIVETNIGYIDLSYNYSMCNGWFYNSKDEGIIKKHTFGKLVNRTIFYEATPAPSIIKS